MSPTLGVRSEISSLICCNHYSLASIMQRQCNGMQPIIIHSCTVIMQTITIYIYYFGGLLRLHSKYWGTLFWGSGEYGILYIAFNLQLYIALNLQLSTLMSIIWYGSASDEDRYIIHDRIYRRSIFVIYSFGRNVLTSRLQHSYQLIPVYIQ